MEFSSAKDSFTNCEVAIKRIDQISSILVARRTLRELKLLRHFKNHPNVSLISSQYLHFVYVDNFHN